MLYAGLRAGCGYVLYCCYLHSTAIEYISTSSLLFSLFDIFQRIPAGDVSWLHKSWGLPCLAAMGRRGQHMWVRSGA